MILVGSNPLFCNDASFWIRSPKRASFVLLMRVCVIALLAIGSLYGPTVTCCVGQENPTATSPGKAFVAGEVNVDYSRLYVFVDKSNAIGHQHAIEGKLTSGKLALKRSDLGALVFDMNSFDADTDSARRYLGLDGTTEDSTRKQVNANMRGASALNVKKFPQARFENIRVQARPGKSARGLPEVLLIGDFTLHEKTLPIEVIADLEQANGWNHIRGNFEILQTSYGIKPFSKMLGAIGIKDKLTIYGDLWIAPD